MAKLPIKPKPGEGKRATARTKITRVRSVDPNRAAEGGYYGEAYGKINSKQTKKVQDLESKTNNRTSRGQGLRKNTNWDGTPSRKTNPNRVSTKASKTTKLTTAKQGAMNKTKAQGSRMTKAGLNYSGVKKGK